MLNVTIFANFFIDTQERYLRLKDSFFSFHGINPKQWLINIRGRFKEKSSDFLRVNLSENLIITFENSDSGWFEDTKKLVGSISSDYIFLWMEDHINIAPASHLKKTFLDFMDCDLDLMYYSFYNIDNRFDNIDMASHNNINYFTLDEETNRKIQENYKGAYIIWYPILCKSSLFTKIINNPPAESQRKWPIDTPFDFEKDANDIGWLPLHVALPKNELFVSIDDDRKAGYSLQSRGLYPIREPRQSYAHMADSPEKRKRRRRLGNIFPYIYARILKK